MKYIAIVQFYDKTPLYYKQFIIDTQSENEANNKIREYIYKNTLNTEQTNEIKELKTLDDYLKENFISIE